MQYAAQAAEANSGHIQCTIVLMNDGTSEVQLSELTLRYWYTREPTMPETAYVDYCKRCIGGVNGKLTLETQRSYADHYVEISWPGGVIPTSAGRDEQINLRIDTTDDSSITNYNQSNDWSFDGTKTTVADWNHITVYRNGALIAGQEPPPF